MLGARSSLNLCQRNDFILTKDNIDSPVTNSNYLMERGVNASLVSTSFIFTAVASPALCYIQFNGCILLLLKFLSNAFRNVLPSTIDYQTS